MDLKALLFQALFVIGVMVLVAQVFPKIPGLSAVSSLAR